MHWKWQYMPWFLASSTIVSLLAGLLKYEIQKYQHIMNSAAHLISGMRKCDHITPVLTSLHWLPVEHRINFKLMCFMASWLGSNLLNWPPDELLTSKVPPLSGAGITSIPKARTVKYAKPAFAYIAPALYNKLPLEMRKSPTFNTFKSGLKTHSFKLAYSP